ncbi:MAG: ThuA domain-containing protein [Kiritimatiellales bacterium]|nr:ThuA domain-containing protein [Kiritimatiellales bacterium]
MMKRIRLCLWAVCFLAGAIGVQAADSLKVLVITGTHKYDNPAFNAMFEQLDGLDCTVKEMGKDPGALFENIEDFAYDAIVMYNFRQTLSEPHRKNFLKLLDKGVGLTVMHHAIAGFPDWIEYENIVGATYVLKEQTRDGKHYPRPTWKHDMDMNIKVEDSNHPITRGVTDFTIHDETYKGWIYHDGNHLLLSTGHELSNHQIAWTHPHPKTSVFFIQLGHDKQSYDNPSLRRLIRQGIIWTAQQKN